MTTSVDRERIADPYDPAGNADTFDFPAWVAGIDARLLDGSEQYRDARIEATKYDPLLFAVLYCLHHLRDPEGNVTFADAHLEWVRLARQWAIPPAVPMEQRDAFLAPRDTGKSTWMLFILPLWAAAHGHVKFAAVFADSGPQAEMHLGTFRKEVDENTALRRDFPKLCTAGRRPSGASESDAKHMVIRGNGFIFAAKGIDASSLGMKVGAQRPDLILCHAMHTPMQDAETGHWHAVQDHPSFRGIRIDDGLTVRLHGLPETETVTTEHRYWARRIQGAERYETGVTTWEPHALSTEPGWVEAKDLTTHHWIGTPIDRTIEDPHPIEFYAPTIVRDPETNRIVSSTPAYQQRVPEEFGDPDWWWFFGLWWGDGSLHGKYQIGITANNNDARVIARLENLLTRYEIAYTHRPRQGCTQIVFSRAHLNRWLRTWRSGPSRKQPPPWVERMPDRYLRELMWGYVDADGFVDRAAQAVRITSIHLSGLLAARRILARLGAAAAIRKSGGEPKALTILGRNTRSQQKYDLRVRQGAEALGFPFADQDRYDPGTVRTFVADGMLWTRVRSVEEAGQCEFAPIKTDSSTYVTHFGMSHNCDDIEPDESSYSAYQADKRLKTVTDAILPLNIYARVILSGTVTMPGSVTHQLVKWGKGERTEANAWVGEQQFRVHHHLPIVTDDFGNERSMWPSKWPLDFLTKIKNTRSYRKNYLNDPMAADGAYWSEDDFTYGTFPTARTYLSVDGAVTTKRTSDFTGLSVVSYAPARPGTGGERPMPARCLVKYAQAVKLKGSALRARVLQLLESFPEIGAILVESNQGGDLWLEVFHDLPVKVVTFSNSEKKETRAERLLNLYQLIPTRVQHAEPLPALEEQMVAFPKAPNDDLVDTVGNAVLRFLKPPARPKAAVRSVSPR